MKLNKRDWNQHPPSLYPAYKSTVLRSPTQALVTIPESLMDIGMPVYGEGILAKDDNDMTKNAQINGDPIGERIIIHGKVMDENGNGISNALVEVWQCNSAGRYLHKVDGHDAPLDPNFSGAGRVLTDNNGDYEFYTIKPGAYPWGNHDNAWRPAHIHFSLFGHQFGNRLITQMYFPGDPLFQFDPIFNSIPSHARKLLVSSFHLNSTEPEFALGYEFNIILRGRNQTPFES